MVREAALHLCRIPYLAFLLILAEMFFLAYVASVQITRTTSLCKTFLAFIIRFETCLRWEYEKRIALEFENVTLLCLFVLAFQLSLAQ